MLQNCCLGFRVILKPCQYFSNSLTDLGQEAPGSEYIVSLPFYVIPFPGTGLPSRTEVLCVTPNLCWNSQLRCESQGEVGKDFEEYSRKCIFSWLSNFKTKQPQKTVVKTAFSGLYGAVSWGIPLFVFFSKYIIGRAQLYYYFFLFLFCQCCKGQTEQIAFRLTIWNQNGIKASWHVKIAHRN